MPEFLFMDVFTPDGLVESMWPIAAEDEWLPYLRQRLSEGCYVESWRDSDEVPSVRRTNTRAF